MPWKSYRRDALARAASVRVGIDVPGWPQVAGVLAGPIRADVIAVDLERELPLPLPSGAEVGLTVWFESPRRMVEVSARVLAESLGSDGEPRRVDFRLAPPGPKRETARC